MLGINGPEFIVLALVALLVVGPERLPQYAAQLGRMVRELRKMAAGARDQVRAELGPDFDDIDWQKLDPRQYDPRRIVREALTDAWEDEPTARRRSPNGSATATGAAAGTSPRTAVARPADAADTAEPAEPPPFDSEAT